MTAPPEHVVVAGARRGLGRALVRELLSTTAAVVTAGVRDVATAQRTIARGHDRLHVRELDLASEDSIVAFVRQLSTRCERIDVLINCGAVTFDEMSPPEASKGPVGSLRFDSMSEVLAVNTIGPTMLAQECVGLLERSERPVIANITSSRGLLSDELRPGSISYAISKAGLNAATRKLAAELPGFVVSGVDPGWIRTDMGGPDAPSSPEEAARDICLLLQNVDTVRTGSVVDRFGNLCGLEAGEHG